MAVLKKFCPDIKIHSFKDLKKDWFLTFRDIHNKRQKKQGKINHEKTFSSRMKAAEALKKNYEEEYTQLPDLLGKLERWLQNEKAKGRWSDKTYQCHWSKVTRLDNYLKGAKLTNETMREFMGEVNFKGEGKTYNNYRTKFIQFLTGIGHENIMDGIEKFSFTCTPARYFQDNQIRQLKDKILERYDDLWFMVQLMANVFLRPKEARMMVVGDFMIEESKVLVRKEVSKNKKTQYIPILPNFLPVVKERLQYKEPGDFLFPAIFKEKKMIGVNTMYNRHLEILKSLNYPKGYELYSWRHTGAVRAVKDGLSLLALSKMMRHYNTAQTEQYLRQLGVFDFLWEIHKYQGI